MAEVEVEQQVQQLLSISTKCTSRGLYNSAKWAAELATAIVKNTGTAPNSAPSDSEEDETPADKVKLVLGKTFFDLRQYDRTAHSLEESQCHRAVFLANYSRYLAGEMRKEDEEADPLHPMDKSAAVNEELKTIRVRLEERDRVKKLDGFGHYLLGLVYKAQKLKQLAIDQFISAANKEPLHWGAWQELANLAEERPFFQNLEKLKLPDHWMYKFFKAYVALELHLTDDALELYTELAEAYPTSNYLVGQVAVARYNRREFDDAEDLFHQLRKNDPYRLDNVDTYSNILYVKEQKPELSYLAHEACRIDQYRVETCCVIGNYYSLKGRHEKAVEYFRRALKLDRNYLAAWTLMGHEYVELKNTPAAIEAYRRAVDVNPRDYRAWYGLGQTYELLKMPMYSLYYYRQAQKQRPNDSRMWSALAQTYKELNQWRDAAKCYERCCQLNENDPANLHGLGLIYLTKLEPNDPDKAAYFFKKAIDLTVDAEESDVTLEAYQFLAEYYKGKEKLEEAEKYAMRLMNVGGKYKEAAKLLLKDIEGLKIPADKPLDLPPPSTSPTPTWF
eukprot:m.341070 g.341070  ORF g.341070 m.341070 type:complete len:561 (+) comp19779_c0_seq1:215-1897(+)